MDSKFPSTHNKIHNTAINCTLHWNCPSHVCSTRSDEQVQEQVLYAAV